MTREQKDALAILVKSQMGDILEFGIWREQEELQDLTEEEVWKQLNTWAKRIPGRIIDTRIE
jgi:hypothetical protein